MDKPETVSIGPAGSDPRLAAIDLARGVGIVLMVVYHGFWDADYFSLLPPALFEGAFWKWFRFAILGIFLLIAGVSLTIAHTRNTRPRAFIKRLAILAACAGAITGVSALAFPEQLIFFGVLHAIAVSSVLGLALVGLAWYWPVLAGIAVVALAGVSLPAFDTVWLGWVGFMPEPPNSRDYVPLFPWAGVFFIGIAAGHLAGKLKPAPTGQALGRWLAFGGRNSLLFYMLHQPILFALLFGIAWLGADDASKPSMLGASAIDSRAYARSFTGACRKSCRQGGLAPERCSAYCGCMLNEVRQHFTADDLKPDRMTPASRNALLGFGKQCLDRTQRPPKDPKKP